MSENNQCRNCGYRYGSPTWLDREAEIERLRAEVGIVVQERQAAYARIAELESLIDKSTSLRLVKKVQDERDEAREAARWMYETMSDVVSEDFIREAQQRWPWLEEGR